MSDVTEKKDVNNQEEVSDSSTETQLVDDTTPPAEESSAVDSQARIPKSRLDEVIHQRNVYRERELNYQAKIKELESRQSGNAAKSNVDTLAARFVTELGMSEDAARKMAVIQLETSETIAKSQTQQLRDAAHRNEIENWSRSLEDKYGDYKSVAPAMEKLFGGLPSGTQDLVVSSKAGLEMLYHQARAEMVDNKAVFDKGVNAGYENKGLKKAISSVPSMGSNGGKTPISREYLKTISQKEFSERKGEIDAWLAGLAAKR